MLQTKNSRYTRTIEAIVLDLFLIAILLFLLNENTQNLYYLLGWKICCLLSCVLIIGLFIYWCHFHGLSKGKHYAFLHAKIYKALNDALYDSGIYTEHIILLKKCAVLPKIKIHLNNNLSGGIIFVENCIKLDRRLDEMPISSALPDSFILISSYISDDCNSYVYEFENFSLEQLKFNSYSEFKNYTKRHGKYELFLDSRHKVPIFHALIIGQTGSGKTYCLYNIILQMLSKSISYELYICDPKLSGLYAIGYKLNPNQVASTPEEILQILNNFEIRMLERKKEFFGMLMSKLDSDYRDFSMNPICLIIDEYSSFRATLAQFDKKTRDRADSIIGNIIREGRQLGCFCILSQQQSNSTNLPTELRENMPLKIILGMSERQTYMTVLGVYPDIAKRKYKQGQGIFVYPQIATAENPAITAVSTLNFDILKAIEENVIESAQEKGA